MSSFEKQWLFFTSILLLEMTDFGYGQTCTVRPITKRCDNIVPPLLVSYREETFETCVDDGEIVEKSTFKAEPKVKFARAEELKDALYTLVLHDVDADNHAAGESKIFWLLNNIPGKDLKVGSVIKGDRSAKYSPLMPKDGTGPHRYMFHLFLQKAPITPKVMDQTRDKFRIGRYAEDNGLCGPKAVNVVRSQSPMM